jgi:hypothetical protein
LNLDAHGFARLQLAGKNGGDSACAEIEDAPGNGIGNAGTYDGNVDGSLHAVPQAAAARRLVPDLDFAGGHRLSVVGITNREYGTEGRRSR